jgi:hypothetical protein
MLYSIFFVIEIGIQDTYLFNIHLHREVETLWIFKYYSWFAKSRDQRFTQSLSFSGRRHYMIYSICTCRRKWGPRGLLSLVWHIFQLFCFGPHTAATQFIHATFTVGGVVVSWIKPLFKSGLQRDVVYLCWLIAPSYTSPKAGGGGELRGLSQWVQLCTSRDMEPK